MSIMRPPPEEQFYKRNMPGHSERTSPRAARFGGGPYSLLGNTDNNVLSLQVQSRARAPSVPNLLNLGSGSQGNSPTAEANPPSPYYTTTAKNTRPGLSLTVGSAPSEYFPRDESGNTITPPPSATKVQFKTPGWRNTETQAAEYSPLSAASASTPSLLRKNSIDSLMRAAATIETNSDLNKAYQDKVSSLIELKNRISDGIRGWPVFQTLHLASDTGHPGGPRKQEEILLDRVSMENLGSLYELSGALKDTVGELIDLKNHSRYVEESIAASLQQQLHIDPSRRVTLPPIESLTMSIRNDQQQSPSDYRFPERSARRPSTPTGTGPFTHQTTSQTRTQLNSTHQRGSLSWPMASMNQTRQAPVSDPSEFRDKTGVEISNQTQKGSSKTAVNGMPIIFKTPSSTTIAKTKNKLSKKRKKSIADGSTQEYRRSLSQGLLLAETIRKNEQATTSCLHCGEASTPEWRRGPYGNRTLCNACGLFYRKLVKKFGVKDANILMRYKREINPEDRRVPSLVNVPATFLTQLNEDTSLDADFNTVGVSPGA